MAKRAPSAAEQDKFILRLPDGMRDRLKTDADKNKRSMNAEIVARLQERDDMLELIEALNWQEKMLREESKAHQEIALALRVECHDLRQQLSSRIPRDQSLYIALDAKGLPLSWAEIMAHIQAIARVVDLDINKIEARIFDATATSNSQRENEWWKLVQHYRKLNKKK